MNKSIFSWHEMSGALLRAVIRFRLLGLLRVVIRFGLLGLLLVAISSVPMEAQQCPRDRAMWIQQTPYDVVRDPTERERDKLFEFATAPEHPIQEFFLSVSIPCSSADRCTLNGESYRAALRLFLREAHRRDIRVHALFGEPQFALERHSQRVRAKVQAILEFNERSPADQKFDGIHLDVEPHTLPQYRCPAADRCGCPPVPRCTNETWAVRRDILRQYLDMNARVVDQLAGQNLDYGVDIPDNWHPFVDERGRFQKQENFLMDYNGTQYLFSVGLEFVEELNGREVSEALREQFRSRGRAITPPIQVEVEQAGSTWRISDANTVFSVRNEDRTLIVYGTQYPTYHLMNMVKNVTFMAYRPPTTTIRRTRHAMEYAAEVGALVYIGVQTMPRSEERPWTYGEGSTFSDGTRSRMEQLLCTIDSAFAGLPSFRGFSYNKYSSYVNMPE